jgi:hypothetical protein
MRGKMPNVTWGTVGLAQTDQFAYHRLAGGAGALYNPRVTAHWCSWLTRCPLKAEITGSSPVCAANSSLEFHAHIPGLTNAISYGFVWIAENKILPYQQTVRDEKPDHDTIIGG